MLGIIVIALILFSCRRLFWGGFGWGFPFGGWGFPMGDRWHRRPPMGGPMHGPMGGPGGPMGGPGRR